MISAVHPISVEPGSKLLISAALITFGLAWGSAAGARMHAP